MTNNLRSKNLSLKKRLEIIEGMNLQKGRAIEMIVNLSSIRSIEYDERRIGYFNGIKKYKNKPSKHSYYYCLEYSSGIGYDKEVLYNKIDNPNIKDIVGIETLISDY